MIGADARGPILAWGMFLIDLDEPARSDAGGSTGDNPSLAPGGFQGVLALEVAQEGRAAKGRSGAA
jgi:hypothetical protein